MTRLRITIARSDDDPAEDLRRAAAIRRDLYAHSPVEVDPDNPLHGTHRDREGRAYFQFVTAFPGEVERVLQRYGHAEYARISEQSETLGPACENCGNIAGPVLPTVCPNCGFRDVAPCPHCHREVPRQLYVRVDGDVFRCPECQHRVRLRFNSPMFAHDGSYIQPLIVVEPAVPLYENR
jgi:hypothetical protein